MSGSQQTLVLQVWQEKKRKNCNNDFPVHDCTQEQNDSPNFFYLSTMKIAVSSGKIAEIQKFG